MQLEPLVNELKSRGYRIPWAREEGGMVQVGFEWMGGKAPTWLRGFELPITAACPDTFEMEARLWRQKVLADIGLGRPSPVVRRMLAEHGSTAVFQAMGVGELMQ